MSPRIVVVGSGGHAKVVADTIFAQGGFELIGFLDSDAAKWGSSVLKWQVLGGDDFLERNPELGVKHFVVAIGGHRSTELRVELFSRYVGMRLTPATFVHPSAVVSPFAHLGLGTIVLANATVQASAKVGSNVIVNTSAIVEHDCVVGDHVQLSPRATLAGGVVVEERAFVGTGAVVLPFCRIGARAIVGAGAVVTRDVLPNAVVYGVPAKSRK